MKRVLYIVFVTITFAFWGCDSNTPHSSNKVLTGVASEVTSCSAVLSATLKIDESQYRNIGVGIMLAETQEDLVSRKGELVNGTLTNGKGLKGGDFMVVVRNLLTEKLLKDQRAKHYLDILARRDKEHWVDTSKQKELKVESKSQDINIVIRDWNE